MTAATRPAEQRDLPELSQQLIAQFSAMVEIVPDFGTGGTENIIMQIFAAESAEDLEAPWTSEDRGLPLGKPLEVQSIAKSQSDHPGGLGFYLTLDCTDLETGERVEYTTGAQSIVAQLVKGYVSGWFPLQVKAVQSEKASRSGTFPQHLEILSRPADNGKGKSRG